MAFDFPASPTLNQIYAPSGGPQYRWDGNAWRTTAAPGIYVAKTGDTMTGDLTINKSLPSINLDRTDANDAVIRGRRGGLNRWVLDLGDLTAESTGNVGSNFDIYRYNDAGTFIDASLTINRASGNATFAKAIIAASVQANTGTIYSYGYGGNNNVGVLYLNSTSDRYLNYDGTNYNFGGAAGLNVTGQLTFSTLVSNTNVAPGWSAIINNASTGSNANGMYVQCKNDASIALAVLNAAASAWALTAYGNGDLATSRNFTAGNNITQTGVVFTINGGQFHYNGSDFYLYWNTNAAWNPIWHSGNCPSSGNYNGYQKFANGMLFQWVNLSSGSGGAAQSTFNWPTAFPSYCLYCIATIVGDVGTSATSVVSISISSFNATSCTTQPRYWAGTFGVATQPYIVFAIGF